MSWVNFVSTKDHDKKLLLLKHRNFDDEMKLVRKYAKSSERAEADEKAHKELSRLIRVKTMAALHLRLKTEEEERRREYIRGAFDIATNFGSRITRWEFLLDKENNRMVYMSIDTMQIRHAKTAICEQCDAIFIQHELKCDGCDAPRSAVNQKLFRPLGFKDITKEI
eukprot:gene23255-29460_t